MIDYSLKNFLVLLNIALNLSYTKASSLSHELFPSFYFSCSHFEFLLFPLISLTSSDFFTVSLSISYLFTSKVDLVILALFNSLIRDLSPLVPIAELSKF